MSRVVLRDPCFECSMLRCECIELNTKYVPSHRSVILELAREVKEVEVNIDLGIICSELNRLEELENFTASSLPTFLDSELASDEDEVILTPAEEEEAEVTPPVLKFPPPSKPFKSTSTPLRPIDPLNEFHLSNFSSFGIPPTSLDSTDYSVKMKRKRQRRDYEEITGRKNKRKKRSQVEEEEIEVESEGEGKVMIECLSEGIDVAKASIPQGKRAGQPGVKIPKKEYEVKLRGKISSATSTKVKVRVEDSDSSVSPSPSSIFDSNLSRSSSFSLSPSPGLTNLDSNSSTKSQRTKFEIEQNLITQDSRLKGFTFSHKTNSAQSTTYIDKSRRSFATRVEATSIGGSKLSSELNEEITFATLQAEKNLKLSTTDTSRGNFQIRQVGVHREMGAKLGYSQDFRKGIREWTELFNGTGFTKARNYAARALKLHYPLIYAHHKNLSRSLRAHSLHFLFGAFPSICINSGNKVACKPHRDQHNLGPGLCGVIPSGEFDSERSGWIILWEARLCVQVGQGDLFLFPSAIFTHSNTAIHKDDKRNSLAFWAGASLFLWKKCGMKCFNELPILAQEKIYSNMVKDWTKAWDRFPVL